MAESATIDFLKKFGLHITNARCMVLMAFFEKPGFITQREICIYTNAAFDRVTIYRTLELFVEKGIIHNIPSMDNIIHYSIMRSLQGADCYQHHLHFLCDACGKTICLETVPIPSMQLPPGFSGKETEVIIKGTCKNCN